MKKLNPKGFGTIEIIILVIVVVGLIVAVDLYVVRTKNKTSQSSNNTNNSQSSTASVPKQTDTVSTANWYIFSNKNLTIKVPDGWKLSSITDGMDLFAINASDIQYKQDVKAAVDVSSEGGADFNSIAFALTKLSDAPTANDKRGVRQKTFKTDAGATVDRYYFTQTNKQADMDIPFGAHEYLYLIQDGNKYAYLKHDVLSGETEQTTYIELALRTLVLK